MPFSLTQISPLSFVIHQTAEHGTDSPDSCSIYLRACSQGFILFNTGTLSPDSLMQFLVSKGLQGSYCIILTSSSLSSIGNLHEFAGTDALVAMGNADSPKLYVNRWLSDLEVLSVMKEPFTILHTPGITRDGICIHDIVDDRIYVGDLFHSGLIQLTSTSDLVTYIESLRTLSHYCAVQCKSTTILYGSFGKGFYRQDIRLILGLAEGCLEESMPCQGCMDGLHIFSDGAFALGIDEETLTRARNSTIDEICGMLQGLTSK